MFISKKEYHLLQNKREDLKKQHRKYTEDLGDIMQTSGSFVNMTPEFDDTEMAKIRTEGQIDEIDKLLDQVTVIDNLENLPKNEVSIYSLVCGKNLSTKESVTYYIQHIFATSDKATIITPTSPIGQALLGKKVGDQVTIPLPENEFQFKIEKIAKKLII